MQDEVAVARADRKAQQVAQIENSFTYHPPKGDQQARYVALREKAKELALLIADSVPAGRYQALALTHLEICSAMGNKGIACDDPA
jgi:hypothetical protein